MVLSIDTTVQLLLQKRLRLIAVAAAIVRDVDAADDIFQQVVLAALQPSVEIRDESHLQAWAVQAARHRAVDWARRKQVQTLPTDLLDLLESSWGDPAEAGSSDQVEALRLCVGKLDEPARTLLRLKYHDGLSTTALMSRLNRSADAVYQSLSRIHRALRHCVHRELGIHRPLGGEIGQEDRTCGITSTSDASKTSSHATGTRP
jgi:RNA polymerase sigma factor (sigma-70 family)